MIFRVLFNPFLGGWVFACASLTVNLGLAETPAWHVTNPSFSPEISPASHEGQLMIEQFQKPDDLKIELFAAEPQLANPVALTVGDKGNVYVVETFRLHAGVTDTRGHMNWLLDDLACRSTLDRVAMYKKYLGDQFESYAGQHDRIRLLKDNDGDGKADFSSVFISGFDHYEDGLAAGVLEFQDSVYFTCIPDLWKFKDTDGDGAADEKLSLHKGYGVHVGFLGHDLHGLIVGPDGKLYYSIGDRGLNVKTSDGRELFHPDYGTVLRCNPDGTELEVFAKGLRNPQELAFDDYGNLFTGENNSDGGDQARWVYLVEGSDSGWRIGFQFLENRGIWNDERMWEPAWEGQPAHLVPPIMNLGDGPSGLAYDPGSGMPARFRQHFYLVDFRGTPGNSGIRSFALQPRGASFEVVDSQKLVWGALATDVTIGPDGALYYCDWVEGWDMPTKGRIYRVFSEDALKEPLIAEVKRLLGEDFSGKDEKRLLPLLGHADRRVRQKAQFALASRGQSAVSGLQSVAASGTGTFARLHAIWGLGQIHAKGTSASDKDSIASSLLPLLKDKDAHVVATVCKVLGEAHAEAAGESLAELLAHQNAHVVAQAAIALGKLKRQAAVPALLQAAAREGGKDPTLRHAIVMGLVGCATEPTLGALHTHEEPNVRLAALLALRRMGGKQAAEFLQDSQDSLVIEAARAIYEGPIDAALPQLAAVRPKPDASYSLWRRVLAANYRLGGADAALFLAQSAANETVMQEARLEALTMLQYWSNPSGQDRVDGLWRPIEPRDNGDARQAAAETAGQWLMGPAKVQLAACQTIRELKTLQAKPAVVALVTDGNASPRARAMSLEVLADLSSQEAMEWALKLLKDNSAIVRSKARTVIAQVDPGRALTVLEAALKNGDPEEQRFAYDTLANLQAPGVDALLASEVGKLTEGKTPASAQLNLLLAAKARQAEEVKQALTVYEQSLSPTDPLAPLRVVLEGGNAEEGEKVFFSKTEVYCQRCHRIANRGGAVGPNLSKLGEEKNREYILQAISNPNAVIAKGFETTVIQTVEGEILSGVVQSEDEQFIRIIDAQAVTHAVPKASIEEKTPGQSAMPQDMVKHLSLSELRDLVEYLAGRKGQEKADAGGHEVE